MHTRKALVVASAILVASATAGADGRPTVRANDANGAVLCEMRLEAQ